jgi:hypothetical protein
MEKPQFELTNEQRQYVGLIPVEENWELVKMNNMYLYFDGDIIRKKITAEESSYLEQELNEKTAENRTILLPKTAKGKPKKLNFTATQSFSPIGIYFSFTQRGYISIANYTTQTTYFSEKIGDGKKIEDLKLWLNDWIAESTKDDLKEIEAFRTAERKHFKFREGDFFAFKTGRRKWGFGRILLDVTRLRKTEEYKQTKNYGLENLMGKPLIVKVYHKISDSLHVDLDELANTLALPSQAIMDNHFYYGEKPIIGHSALVPNDLDMLISFGRSISGNDKDTVYLQYGLIYKECGISDFNKYLIEKREGENNIINPYRREQIGYELDLENLEQCIAEGSNHPYWNGSYYTLKYDLRNPANIEIKREVFSHFGLNADKDYTCNLTMAK